MSQPRTNRILPNDFARKSTLALAAALVSAALSACGGGGDDSAAVTSPTNSTPAASTRGAAAAGPAGDAGAADTGTDSAASTESAPDAVADRSATLSWNPPTMNEDGTPLMLTGYRIYWGPFDDYYPQSVTVKNPGLTRYVVENLAPTTWYFVVTALAGEVESAPSNVLKMEVR